MSQSFGEEHKKHKENEEHIVLSSSCSSKKKRKKNLTNFFLKIIGLEIFVLFLSDVALKKN